MKSEAEVRRMLSRWIYRCPELVDELKKISPYFYKKKELSKKEVKLIIQHLRDPLRSPFLYDQFFLGYKNSYS